MSSERSGAGARGAARLKREAVFLFLCPALCVLVLAGAALAVNVKTDFGAVGNGEIDDWGAIQDALDYCIANSENLFFPVGTYLVSSPLVVENPTGEALNGFKIYGEFAPVTRQDSGGSTIRYTGDGDSVCLTVGGPNHIRGMVIEDLRFVGPNPDYLIRNTETTGLFLNYCIRHDLNRVTITGFAVGFKTNMSHACSVRSSSFIRNYVNMVAVEGINDYHVSATDLSYAWCGVEWRDGYGVAFDTCNFAHTAVGLAATGALGDVYGVELDNPFFEGDETLDAIRVGHDLGDPPSRSGGHFNGWQVVGGYWSLPAGAMALRADGDTLGMNLIGVGFDRSLLDGGSQPYYVTWIGGTGEGKVRVGGHSEGAGMLRLGAAGTSPGVLYLEPADTDSPSQWAVDSNTQPLWRPGGSSGEDILTTSRGKTAVSLQTTAPSGGSVTLDGDADLVVVNLTGDVSAISISGGAEGRRLTVHWAQDATGGRSVAGWPSDVVLAGGSYANTQGALGRDSLTFLRLGGRWVECAGRVMDVR